MAPHVVSELGRYAPALDVGYQVASALELRLHPGVRISASARGQHQPVAVQRQPVARRAELDREQALLDRREVEIQVGVRLVEVRQLDSLVRRRGRRWRPRADRGVRASPRWRHVTARTLPRQRRSARAAEARSLGPPMSGHASPQETGFVNVRPSFSPAIRVKPSKLMRRQTGARVSMLPWETNTTG